MIPSVTNTPEERIPLRDYLHDALAKWVSSEPIPYIWGGQNWETGVDCSGFVILGLIEAGILPHGFDDTAAGLWGRYITSSWEEGIPALGDLCFFGRNKITHVGMYYHDDIMIHAGGGGRACTTREIAYAKRAWVRPSWYKYRSDFRGFGRVI